MRAALLAAAAALALAWPAAAPAAQRWTLDGPERLRAVVTLDGGALALSVRRGGRVLLAPGPLGLRTAGGRLDRGLRALGATRARPRRGGYRTVVGKRLRHRIRAVGRVLRLAGAGGGRLDVELRVDEDGVAYRYRLPARRRYRVLGEAGAFTLPPGERAWLSSYQEDDPAARDESLLTPFYESPRTEAVTGEARGEFVYPALFALGGGEHALITEAGLDGGYAGTHLRATGGGRFAVVPPRPDPSVSGRGPLTTPWRVAVLGDLATVVESDLVQDLAAPARVRDARWIRPGRVAWSWNADVESPRSLEVQRAYVDSAARSGRRYVLVDVGWDPAWAPGLIRYARARGVGIFLWTRFSELRTAAERRAKLARWARWGASGVKIDFTLCDCQRRQRWFDDVLARTARLRLLVNLHGTTVPRGLERTWPHVLTVEAVWGGEIYNTFTRLGVPGVPQPPTALTALPFTRNVVGPMDFTPVLPSVPNRATSEGFELATAVVFESGLQHWADSLAAYAARPALEAVLAQVPVVWDETRLLAGTPGTGAVLARRRGRTWWVAGISATGPRRVRVPLRFLAPGRWRARVTTDAPPGGHAVTGRGVARGDVLAVDLPAVGGFVARLTPAA